MIIKLRKLGSGTTRIEIVGATTIILESWELKVLLEALKELDDKEIQEIILAN